MKICSIIAFVWSFVISVAIANEDFYTKVSRIDGLPARLLQAGVLGKESDPEARSIDLAPVFIEMGCDLEEGTSILYQPATGMLIRNLDENTHKMVDEVLDHIYRADNQIATCRAYYDLLAPLSSEDRLRTIMRIGFLPDPLVASMVSQLRDLTALLKVHDKSPANLNDQPKQPSELDLQKIKLWEKATSSTLDIAIDRLKSQLAVIETSKVGATGPSGGDKPVK